MQQADHVLRKGFTGGYEMYSASGPSYTKLATLAGVAALFGVAAFLATRSHGTSATHPMAAPTTDSIRAEVTSPPAPISLSSASGQSSATPKAVEGASAEPADTSVDSTAAPSMRERAAAAAFVVKSSQPPNPVTIPSADVAPGDEGGQVLTFADSMGSRRASRARMSSGAATGTEAAPKVLQKASPLSVDALRAWWQSSETSPFSVQYVGQAADQAALVIRFSNDVRDLNGLTHHIRLVSQQGQLVDGGWQSGANQHVVVHPNLQPGRYMVFIDSQVVSANGTPLGVMLHGPIYID